MLAGALQSLVVVAAIAFISLGIFLTLFAPAMIGDWVSAITDSKTAGLTIWITLQIFVVGLIIHIVEEC